MSIWTIVAIVWLLGVFLAAYVAGRYGEDPFEAIGPILAWPAMVVLWVLLMPIVLVANLGKQHRARKGKR